MGNNSNGNCIVIAFVGHSSIEDLADIKKAVEGIPGFKIVFFKTSSDKLWIKEGIEDDVCDVPRGHVRRIEGAVD